MKAFEDALNTFSETFCTTTTEYDRMLIMFKAGMLRAVEIAEDIEEGCWYGCQNIIVDAIRKEAGDGKQ